MQQSHANRAAAAWHSPHLCRRKLRKMDASQKRAIDHMLKEGQIMEETSGILTADLHGKNTYQAKITVDALLRRAGRGTYRLRLIHGCHSGTALRDFLRSEYAGHPKVRRRHGFGPSGVLTFLCRNALCPLLQKRRFGDICGKCRCDDLRQPGLSNRGTGIKKAKGWEHCHERPYLSGLL